MDQNARDAWSRGRMVGGAGIGMALPVHHQVSRHGHKKLTQTLGPSNPLQTFPDPPCGSLAGLCLMAEERYESSSVAYLSSGVNIVGDNIMTLGTLLLVILIIALLGGFRDPSTAPATMAVAALGFSLSWCCAGLDKSRIAWRISGHIWKVSVIKAGTWGTVAG